MYITRTTTFVLLSLMSIVLSPQSNAQTYPQRQRQAEERALLLEHWEQIRRIVQTLNIGSGCGLYDEVYASAATSYFGSDMYTERNNAGLNDDQSLDPIKLIQRWALEGKTKVAQPKFCEQIPFADKARIRRLAESMMAGAR